MVVVRLGKVGSPGFWTHLSRGFFHARHDSSRGSVHRSVVLHGLAVLGGEVGLLKFSDAIGELLAGVSFPILESRASRYLVG